jgi:hypothetical protein
LIAKLLRSTTSVQAFLLWAHWHVLPLAKPTRLICF